MSGQPFDLRYRRGQARRALRRVLAALASLLLALLVFNPAWAAGDEAPLLQCGNGVCEGVERADTCPQDCLTVSACGDGVCAAAAGETVTSCPGDCVNWGALICMGSCGNGTCDPGCGENITTCAQDCGIVAVFCGDGVCDAGENITTCPGDCPAQMITVDLCGDGACTGGESHDNCPADCPAPAPSGAGGPVCGDGICQAGESPDWCGDCAPQQPAPQQPAGQAPAESGDTPTPTSTPTTTPTSTPTEAPTQTPIVVTATPETKTTVGVQCPIVVGSLVMVVAVVGPLGAVLRRRRVG